MLHDKNMINQYEVFKQNKADLVMHTRYGDLKMQLNASTCFEFLIRLGLFILNLDNERASRVLSIVQVELTTIL